MANKINEWILKGRENWIRLLFLFLALIIGMHRGQTETRNTQKFKFNESGVAHMICIVRRRQANQVGMAASNKWLMFCMYFWTK